MDKIVGNEKLKILRSNWRFFPIAIGTKMALVGGRERENQQIN